MIIQLENDPDELIFNEELLEHKSEGSLRKSKNIMCISLPVQAKDCRFILDSGSGHDLICARKAERMNLKMRARKDTDCVQHVCPRLQHCCLFVSTAEAT